MIRNARTAAWISTLLEKTEPWTSATQPMKWVPEWAATFITEAIHPSVRWPVLQRLVQSSTVPKKAMLPQQPRTSPAKTATLVVLLTWVHTKLSCQKQERLSTCVRTTRIMIAATMPTMMTRTATRTSIFWKNQIPNMTEAAGTRLSSATPCVIIQRQETAMISM